MLSEYSRGFGGREEGDNKIVFAQGGTIELSTGTNLWAPQSIHKSKKYGTKLRSTSAHPQCIIEIEALLSDIAKLSGLHINVSSIQCDAGSFIALFQYLA